MRHLKTLSEYWRAVDGLRGAESVAEGEGSGTPPSNGTESDTPVSGGNGVESFSREYVESLRAENARYRTRAKELEDADAERRKQELSEIDRLKLELEEKNTAIEAAEQNIVSERRRNAVIAEASKLKFRDPSDALAYIDLTAITLNSDGTPDKRSVETAVKKVAEEKTYLIAGPGTADGASTGRPPKPESEWIKQQEADIQARGGVAVPT